MKENASFRNPPAYKLDSPKFLLQLCIAANFTEIFLAKEGHNGPVGINLLAKIELPTLACLYGAMLAGVDYVIMGAGIPFEIPAILDTFTTHESASLKVNVEGATRDDDYRIHLNPKELIHTDTPLLKRPNFLPIVSSDILAKALLRRANGEVNGFVVENFEAGGHNAPPRGRMQLNEKGEPIYGHRDVANIEKFREVGVPFWLAGSYGHPDKVAEAIKEGATGVQIGTPFALCQESGLTAELRDSVLAKIRTNTAEVITDPLASPTGFPFKVISLEGTLSDNREYEARQRICDLGYLRTAYKKEDGTVGYRCPAEPVETYLKKGGSQEATAGRKCLCNGLAANMGQPQFHVKTKYREQALVTMGDGVMMAADLFANGQATFSAKDVIEYLKR